jgi:hypothetical protein
VMPATPAAVQETQAQIDLRRLAAAVARSGRGPRQLTCPAAHGPLVTVLRQSARQRRSCGLGWGGGGLVAVFELVTCDADGRLVDETLIPLRFDGVPSQMGTPSLLMVLATQLMVTATPLFSSCLDRAVSDRLNTVVSVHARAAGLLAARWEAIRDAARATVSSGPFQDGLFEHRAVRNTDAILQRRRTVEHTRGDATEQRSGPQGLVTTISLGWLHG